MRPVFRAIFVALAALSLFAGPAAAQYPTRPIRIIVPAAPGGGADLPTIAEAGLRGYEATGWFGLLAPARTPPDIVARLSAEVGRLLRLEDVRARLAQLGAEPAPSTPEGFTRYINDDIAKWLKLIRDLGIKMEN